MTIENCESSSLYSLDNIYSVYCELQSRKGKKDIVDESFFYRQLREQIGITNEAHMKYFAGLISDLMNISEEEALRRIEDANKDTPVALEE